MRKIVVFVFISLMFYTVGCTKGGENKEIKENDDVGVNNVTNENADNNEDDSDVINVDEEGNDDSEGLQDVDNALDVASDNAREALNVMIKNIELENERDLEGYLNTLTKELSADKEKDLEAYFESIEHVTTILGLNVVSESDEEVAIMIKQHSGLDLIDPKSDNVAYVTLKYTLIKENGTYRLSEVEIIENVSLEDLE